MYKDCFGGIVMTEAIGDALLKTRRGRMEPGGDFSSACYCLLDASPLTSRPLHLFKVRKRFGNFRAYVCVCGL